MVMTSRLNRNNKKKKKKTKNEKCSSNGVGPWNSSQDKSFLVSVETMYVDAGEFD